MTLFLSYNILSETLRSCTRIKGVKGVSSFRYNHPPLLKRFARCESPHHPYLWLSASCVPRRSRTVDLSCRSASNGLGDPVNQTHSHALDLPKECTVAVALNLATSLFEEENIPEACTSAEFLLSSVLCSSRSKLRGRGGDSVLTPTQKMVFLQHISQRLARTPVQYIVGQWPFHNLERDLKLRPPTLIPRPETEELVELILQTCREEGLAPRRFLEVGSGPARTPAPPDSCRRRAPPPPTSFHTQKTPRRRRPEAGQASIAIIHSPPSARSRRFKPVARTTRGHGGRLGGHLARAAAGLARRHGGGHRRGGACRRTHPVRARRARRARWGPGGDPRAHANVRPVRAPVVVPRASRARAGPTLTTLPGARGHSTPAPPPSATPRVRAALRRLPA
jgi:hypothetical protein